MEKKYTQQDLDIFFSTFKELPNSINLEKIHQLINTPNAGVKLSVKSSFKPFKFIIMASTFIIGLTSLIVLLMPNTFISKSDKQNKEIGQKGVQINRVYSANDEIRIIETQTNKTIKPLSKFTANQEITLKNNTDTVKTELVSSERVVKSHKTKETEYQQVYKITNTQNSNSNSIKNETSNIIKAIKLLELSTLELQNIGFIINKNSIQIITKSSAGKWRINLSKQVQGVYALRFHKTKKGKPKLIFLSNNKGKQMIKWKSFGDNSKKMENEYFESKIQELIPVILKQTNYPEILNEDQVFWFEPSHELFESLPSRITLKLKPEYEYITKTEVEEK